MFQIKAGLNGTQIGFDIVIGNPPYKRVGKDEPDYKYFNDNYMVAKGGKTNLYKIFYEKGIGFLKKNSVLSYITPNTYITSKDNLELRKILIEKDIVEIIEYTEKDKIFENVAQAVATIVLKNTKSKAHRISIKTDKQGHNQFRQDLLLENDKIMFLPINSIVEKINLHQNKAGDYLDIYQGEINLTFKKKFYSETEKKNTLPMWRGNNVDKYSFRSIPNEFCEKEADNRQHWKQERIVTQQVSNQSQQFRTKAFLTPRNYFCGNSTNYAILKENTELDLKLFLGIINSSVFNYYFNYFSFTNHLTVVELERIPIPSISHNQQRLIVSLVDKIITTKAKNPQADTSDLERQIDELVYGLYGITDKKEIAIIAGK